MKTLIALVITTCFVSSTWALEPASAEAPIHESVPEQYSQDILPDREGMLSWTLLAQVKETQQSNRIIPKFSDQVAALDNTEVKVHGFMMPLDSTLKQKHFLISAIAPSCAFCLPGRANSLVEVFIERPILYTFDPIIVSGKLRVLKNDPLGLYYRLEDAVVVNQ